MKELHINEKTTGLRRNNFFTEVNSFFREYFELTGEEFPPCDQNRWSSLDDWFVDLKLAVYRERAIREIYGSNCNVIPLKGIHRNKVPSEKVS